MALSQACWQSECQNQGEMKGTVPSRKCHCRDRSLAWSQSMWPLWQGKPDWTFSFCCPRGPHRGQALTPKWQPVRLSQQESEGRARATRWVPAHRAGQARPECDTSVPELGRGVLPPGTLRQRNNRGLTQPWVLREPWPEPRSRWGKRAQSSR